MKIQINSLHPNTQTLASRLVDAKFNRTPSIQVDTLDDIQKRFLHKHEIEYSFNSQTEKWEVQTNG